MSKLTSEEIGRLTEGELFVAKYLQAQRIRFEPQLRIDVSRGSGKGYRIIDFFLPEFNVYLEYNGQWDVNEWHRNRYRQKRKELLDYGLTLVEIYPNQLGIIEYSFPVKMIQALSSGSRTNGFLRSFKWKLVKGHDQWPDYFDWLILILLNATVFIDPLAWVYFIPFTALFIGLKTFRLFKFWKELSTYECPSDEQPTGLSADGIVEECLEDLRAHGLNATEHLLVQFLKGQNASYFTELLESRGFGYFQHLSNAEVHSIIQEANSAVSQPLGFKKQAVNTAPASLNRIREKIRESPIIKHEVDDHILGYRQKFRRSHEPWEEWEVQLLEQAYRETQDVHVLSDVFERSSGAIQSRLTQLN